MCVFVISLKPQQQQPEIIRRNMKSKNLTAITWAHAVNSQFQLSRALNRGIDMIEADIVLGKLNNSGPDIPVMAHPPGTTSDISLDEFLNRITQHNQAHVDEIKGVKLDFKTIEVFEGSLDILSELIPFVHYPIWLNADIVPGPVNETKTIPVDPERFFTGCARFKNAVLSVGWTTCWGANYTDGAYTSNEIHHMIQAINQSNVSKTGQAITFPVRAGIAANSKNQLRDLMRAVNDTNENSLTIWSSTNDYVDIDKLRQLILSIGLDRVYLDVPAELVSQLDLGRASSNAGVPTTLLHFGLISACLVLTSFILQRKNL